MNKIIEEMSVDVSNAWQLANQRNHFPNRRPLCEVIAEELYEMDYRKVVKDSPLMTKEEIDEINRYKSYIPELKKAFDKIHNEAIREVVGLLTRKAFPEDGCGDYCVYIGDVEKYCETLLRGGENKL